MAQELANQGALARRPTINVVSPAAPARRPTLALPFRRPTLPPDVDPRLMPQSVPNPSHRHGTPSGPWPFLDLHTSIDPREILEPKIDSATCTHHRHTDDKHCWCQYPQSLFPNWTLTQQKSSRITKALRNLHGWIIYSLLVTNSGHFRALKPMGGRFRECDAFWGDFRTVQERDFHVRALFIDNMAGPIMQMLGTKYNIEPFFFSSSFGWIPSRYQENRIPDESDHITVTLTFIRCMNDPANHVLSPTSDDDVASNTTDDEHDTQFRRELVIDTNAPLYLRSNQKIIFSDIISLHLIRDPKAGNTIISYHPPREFRATSAKQLYDRFQLTGSSVYWSKIFSRTKDPTFVLLSLLWYALYAWDQSFEELYAHICHLESEVLDHNDLDFTQELHVIRANLLQYASLLADFRKTVRFVLNTPFPGLDNPAYFTEEQKRESEILMKKECKTLLNEIERLEMGRRMQDKRLKNVMDLGFSTVHIEDSKQMQDLTRAAVRDSAAMKQIAYLTMFFLPASFVATVFGMNVVEINPTESRPTLGHYFAAAIPLTLLTIWIIGALHAPIEEARPARSRGRHAYDPPVSPSQTRHDHTSDHGTNSHVRGAGPGPELRRAYTTEDGDVVGFRSQPFSSNNDYHDDYIDEDVYEIEGGQPRLQHFGVWKRLGWPISLTQAFLVKRREARDKRDKTRRRALSPSSFSTGALRRGLGKGGAAETLAADDNPNSSNSVTPTAPPSEPKKGKRRLHPERGASRDPAALGHGNAGDDIGTAAAVITTERSREISYGGPLG